MNSDPSTNIHDKTQRISLSAGFLVTPLIAVAVFFSLVHSTASAQGTVDIFRNYKVLYEVTRGGSPVGKAYYNLSQQNNGCYVYQGFAKPEGIAALLVSTTVERSEFCVNNGAIQPRSYRMWQGEPDDMADLDADVAGDDDEDIDDRNYVAIFRNGAQQGQTNALPPKPLPISTVDNSSMHFAIRSAVAQQMQTGDRQPFEITVYKENKIKKYQFKIKGGGNLETAAGKFETVRVERVDHKKKRLTFWLAADRNYLPVKVKRSKKGGSDLTMTLRKVY